MAVAQFGANAASIEEIITDATVVALNAALAEHGVSPDRVVAIHYLEGVYVANGPSPRFRVLYRV